MRKAVHAFFLQHRQRNHPLASEISRFMHGSRPLPRALVAFDPRHSTLGTPVFSTAHKIQKILARTTTNPMPPPPHSYPCPSPRDRLSISNQSLLHDSTPPWEMTRR
mmetsp:Transcript_40178/g.80544  ORF Transcript_40178/g.80544 Transcript_40178/m.80544 type:complete len:107 (-) Transcript_40178:17-337(-)